MVPFSEACRIWLRIGLMSFGGPAGQIAMMHKLLVEERNWINESRFLNALNYCMLLPGPEAQQLAIYIGWLMHRTRGGLVAGLLFILPGACVMFGLSTLYILYHDVQLVQGFFFGLKAAVLAVVVEAIIRISKRALKNRIMKSLALSSFIAIFFFNVSFPVIIISAGLIGLIGGRWKPELFSVLKGHSAHGTDKESIFDHMIASGQADHIQPSFRRSIIVVTISLLLWFGLIGGLVWFLGTHHPLTEIAVFFSKMALVTFGGAYAVLAYVAQAAVSTYHWLSPNEMLYGLSLAETTPGPLILVLQFVGFIAATRHPGTMDPLLAGLAGSLITLWVTFLPCFLWIFLGAPYIERLRGNHHLSAALSTITAAVVGVMMNLAVWFGIHVIFKTVHQQPFQLWHLIIPEWRSVDIPSLIITIIAMVAMLRFKVKLIPILIGSSLIGILLHTSTYPS